MKIICVSFVLAMMGSYFQVDENRRTKDPKVKDGWSESYGVITKKLDCNC